MSKLQKKYPASLTLEQLEVLIADDEALLGSICALQAVGHDTIAVYDAAWPQPQGELILSSATSTSPRPGTTLVLDGRAFVNNAEVAVSVFRTTPPVQESWPTAEPAAEGWDEMPDADGDDFGFITGPARPPRPGDDV